MQNITDNKKQVELKDNLFFAGTIYETFEALEEVLTKLKLEQPLFLVNLAKKSFAEAVLQADAKSEHTETMETVILPSSPIKLDGGNYRHLQ